MVVGLSARETWDGVVPGTLLGGNLRYAPEHKEKTRARILAAAGRVFRRLGYRGAGVDKVMEEAGLTAGGFYAHFDSKESLLAEAIEHVRAESGERRKAWTGARSGREWIEAFMGGYLSQSHRRQIEDGCALAALVSEVARADDAAKASFEALIRELLGELESQVGECGCGPANARERAIAAVALCVGGLALARGCRTSLSRNGSSGRAGNRSSRCVAPRVKAPLEARPRLRGQKGPR